jgi:hypothetical protein
LEEAMKNPKPARTRPATPITINGPTRNPDPASGRVCWRAGIRVAEADVLDAANDYRPVANGHLGDYGVAARILAYVAIDGTDLGATVSLLRDDGRTQRKVSFKTAAEALAYAHQAVAKRYRVAKS